ncbi:MAG TPA: insulinase family protein, partial [Gammaproteobacteria bacterium]|nr:insulinase family protein [Gammaproteobacteria bacterium]
EYYGLQCPGLETAGDISREEVLSTFREFYVPNNMTLVVVGDFDKREIIERSRETFGKMVRKPVSRLEPESYVDFFGKTFTGTLSPLIGSEAAIFICYPANEELLANRYPLRLVGQYLSDLLYKTIRVEHGLSYSPEAAFVAGEDLGFLCASADVDLEDMDKALELLQREIDSLAASPLDERKVEITKRGLLLRLVQMGESNAEYADYYASNLEDLEHGGRFADNGEQIEIVTAKMMHEAAAKVIHDGRKIVIINEPTLTYTQFYLLMLMLPVLLLAAGWWLYKRRLRLRRIE